MMTLFDFVVKNIDPIVNAVIEENGYQGPKYNALIEPGFEFNNGVKDIQKCREFIDHRVKERTKSEQEKVRLQREIQETLQHVEPPTRTFVKGN